MPHDCGVELMPYTLASSSYSSTLTCSLLIFSYLGHLLTLFFLNTAPMLCADLRPSWVAVEYLCGTAPMHYVDLRPSWSAATFFLSTLLPTPVLCMSGHFGQLSSSYGTAPDLSCNDRFASYCFICQLSWSLSFAKVQNKWSICSNHNLNKMH